MTTETTHVMHIGVSGQAVICHQVRENILRASHIYLDITGNAGLGVAIHTSHTIM